MPIYIWNMVVFGFLGYAILTAGFYYGMTRSAEAFDEAEELRHAPILVVSPDVV